MKTRHSSRRGARTGASIADITPPPGAADAPTQPARRLPPGAVTVPITPAQAQQFAARFGAIRQIQEQIQAAAAMVCEGRVLGLAGTPDAPELVVMPTKPQP